MDNDRAASNSSSGGYKCDDQRVDDLLKSGELPDIVSAFELLWAAREKSSVVLGDRIGRLLLAECAQHVDEQGGDEESKELLQLLNSPHVKAIVESYDGVVLEREEAKRSATEITTPTFSPEANQKSLVNGTGETSNGESGPLKLIGLNRVGNEALGLVLKDADGLVKISRIVVGMAADRQGLLKVGDVIRSINGKEVNGDVEMVKKEITSCRGTISMKVEASFTDPLPTSQVYMRVLFDYDPQQDPDHPFPKGGLAFRRGDVLQIVNQEDPMWWQARIEKGENADRSGIIPGLLLEERRQAIARDPGGDADEQTPGCLGMRRRRRSRPVMYTSARNSEFDRHELNIFEEVARIAPGQRKTVVLIGAQGVGRRGLKHRIIVGSPDMYATTLPHTTRRPKPDEENGKQYWFVSEEVMREDIASHKYIEHGVFNDCLYGTKIDSIRAVIRSGKICLLDVNPQSLKRLKTSEFKPYVIFIRAPTFAVLKRMHHEATRNNSETLMPYSDDDIRRTIHESENIEKAYSHYFDLTIVNEGIDETYIKLDEVLRDLQASTQWVPINWVF
eukprot:scpid65043/ scgid5577/ MAGUK p55 subfamily member 6; Veli-associated MAGUK 1